MQHSAFPVCICRLTQAWISSETSTKLLGTPTYPDRSSSLLWTLSHAKSSLCCPVSTALSYVRRQLPSSSPFVQLPSCVPLPTSGHAKISSPKPFVWFRAKTDKGIVCLADLLHSVTDQRTLTGYCRARDFFQKEEDVSLRICGALDEMFLEFIIKK